jgi:hypothetical protein
MVSVSIMPGYCISGKKENGKNGKEEFFDSWGKIDSQLIKSIIKTLSVVS